MGLRALNTCGHTLADSELRTCGIKRRSCDRSQIDFLTATCDLHGVAGPVSILDLQSEEPLYRKMDHRPVVGQLSWLQDDSAVEPCVKRVKERQDPKRNERAVGNSAEDLQGAEVSICDLLREP